VAALRILVDTDVFIDYFNAGQYAGILDDRHHLLPSSEAPPQTDEACQPREVKEPG
jgi:hypothetical protein